MYFLGLNLMVTPANSGSVTSSIIERLPYFLAVAAVVASGWYQMWQTQLRQKRLGNSAQNNPINKQMQLISRVFPILFGWFSWIASSGLVLYFVTSSLWRIGQQHLVLNKYYDEHPGAEKSKKEPKKEPSPDVIDIEEAPRGSSKGNPGRRTSGKNQLPPSKPASTPESSNGRPAGNGAGPKPQPSQHTSRKKRKRRR